MNKRSSKAKPKRLPGVGSNRMLGCGVLVIATPAARKYQLDHVEQDADLMVSWDGKKVVALKNRGGPPFAGQARTITQVLRVIAKGVEVNQPNRFPPDPPAIQATEECKNASQAAFYHLRNGHELAARVEMERLIENARWLENIINGQKQPND